MQFYYAEVSMSICHKGEIVLYVCHCMSSEMRLIQLLVIVQWVRFRSHWIFEVRTFGVARSLSTQIKLVSDHLRVCLSIRNCSRCLEALQKAREAGVRMHVCTHMHFGGTKHCFSFCLRLWVQLWTAKTISTSIQKDVNARPCVFVERPIVAADGGNFPFAQAQASFSPRSLILGVMYAARSIFSLNDGEFKRRKMKVCIWDTRRPVWTEHKCTS